jgi:phosphate-selective porin OprO/OprP
LRLARLATHRWGRAGGRALLAGGLLLAALPDASRAAPSAGESAAVEEAEGVEAVAPGGWSLSWWPALRLQRDDGVHGVRLGGRLLLDGALIHYDDSLLELSSPSGWNTVGDIRQGRIFLTARALRRLVLKTEVDFAPKDPSLTDAYLGVIGTPRLQRIRFGHQKHPFSLEKEVSRKYMTFMERSLVKGLFPQARDIGLGADGTELDQRLRWALGVFRDTDSTGMGFSEPANYAVAARLTGLPIDEGGGRRLLELGISYAHGFRDAAGGFSIEQRPESHLADQLLDTGNIAGVRSIDALGLETVWVHGPFSAQGEYVHNFLSRRAGPDLDFWGVYVQASWFLTGEHRVYARTLGNFAQVQPEREFAPWKGRWGAFQVAARFSHLDLDDEEVRGGVESNATLGLNWYLLPVLRLSANYVFGHLAGQGNVNIVQGRFQIEY